MDLKYIITIADDKKTLKLEVLDDFSFHDARQLSHDLMMALFKMEKPKVICE
jgi:hypothetical protein